jgi:outer membrane receptor for ferrienterochelin and colicins
MPYHDCSHLFPNTRLSLMSALTGRTLLIGIAVTLFALPAPAQTGTISGRVTDAGTGAGVASAGVRVLAGIRNAGGTATDESGNYRISNIPAGTYTVEARRVGYAPTRRDAVVVGAGASATVDIAMGPLPTMLEVVITGVSRSAEKIIDAPASVSRVNAVQVNERPSVTVADHVAALPGIDVARGGLMRSNIVARGFNNIFSGAMMTLTDNRFAFVPSLRVNIPYLNPTVNEDIDHIEVILGPGAALYGPNTPSGVMSLSTKSPFGTEGVTVTVDGGNQDVLRGSVRTAWTTGKIGVKASIEGFRGTEWPFVPSDTIGEQQPRDRDLNRYGGEFRVDFRPTAGAQIIANYGRSQAGRAVEPTGLGPAQVKDWIYNTYQLRARYKELFGQVFMNTSDAGGSFLLRAVRPSSNCPDVTDPACVIDRSRQIVGQLQHGLNFGTRERLIYGFDYIYTEPRTEGTLNGRNEDDDDINERGGYIHSVTTLSRFLQLTAAARVDKHSRLEDPVFSPRLALVFKPEEEQSFRVTYNRAFSTPSTLNLFLDLEANRIPPTGTKLFGVRGIGVPSTGYHFKRDCAGGVGSLCMRVPDAFGGNPANQVPANAALLYKAAVAAAGPSLVAGLTAAFIAQQVPAAIAAAQAAGIVQYIGSLQPGPTEVGTRLRQLQSNGTFRDVDPGDLRDVERLKPTIHTTFEGGYKGIIADRLQLSLDVWHENRRNFVGPLIVETPNVFLDAPTLGAFLAGKLPLIGLSAAQIAQLAPTLAGALGGVSGGTGAAVGVPLAVVNFNEPLSAGSDVIVTYRNFGKLNLWGSDFGGEFLIGGPWSVAATYSYVNKKLFPRSEVGGVQDISLNAPANKHSFSIHYRDDVRGISGELRERHVDGYRALSFIDGEVKAYTLVDANFSIRPAFLNGVMWSIGVTNLLDNDHQEFVQGSLIGRLVMTRLQATF